MDEKFDRQLKKNMEKNIKFTHYLFILLTLFISCTKSITNNSNKNIAKRKIFLNNLLNKLILILIYLKKNISDALVSIIEQDNFGEIEILLSIYTSSQESLIILDEFNKPNYHIYII